MLKLVLPKVKYKNEFYKFVKELEKEKQISKKDVKKIMSFEFSDYVRKVKGQAKGLNLKKDYVPQTEFWLIDNNVLIGNLTIRHKLNKTLKNIGGHIGYTIRLLKRRKGYGKEILRLGLLKAKKINLKKVLITCDKDNISSKKIIEANGGKLQNEFFEKGMKIPKLRYWININ